MAYAGIKQVLVNKLSATVHQSPWVQREPANVKWTLGVNVSNENLGNGNYVVSLGVEASLQQDNGVSLMDSSVVVQGHVQITDVSEEEIKELVEVYFPNQLVHYARTHLTNATSSVGYGPVVLPHLQISPKQAEQAPSSATTLH